MRTECSPLCHLQGATDYSAPESAVFPFLPAGSKVPAVHVGYIMLHSVCWNGLGTHVAWIILYHPISEPTSEAFGIVIVHEQTYKLHFWFWICCKPQTILVLNLSANCRPFFFGGFSKSANCRPFWFWSWWPTAEHSGSESAANRRPFWFWIYYLGKWKKEEGRRRDGGGCSTVVNRLSVPRPLARRASHLRLPTSTRSPLLLSLCLAHFSRSLDPQPPRHFRSLLPLFRTHFRSHTHPPTTSNPPYPTSQYIFLSIYLSIYLSPFDVQSLFWILLLTTPHFQKTKTHLQINKLSWTVFVSKITLQSS
jgi:hypothetical protein